MADILYNTALVKGIYGEMFSSPGVLKQGVLKSLRVKDETEFCRRVQWFNLPSGLSGDLIERILYYKGEGMFFYIKELDKFFFLPYVMQGDFDVYGRYTSVAPVPFTGETEVKKGSKASYITNFVRTPIYGIPELENLKIEDILDSCVLLHDYTQQLSQHTQPRAAMQEHILSAMAECVPFMRTRLIANTGVKGMRVANADDQKNVTIASRNVVGAALEGDMYVPIVGSLEFQDLTNSGSQADEYMMAYQSLDNIRKANLGIASSGAFEKSAHTLQSEQAMNASSVDLVLQDAITLRQNFCNIVNSIWGIGIWCEPSETLIMADLDGDGVDYDRDQQDNQQPSEGGETNE